MPLDELRRYVDAAGGKEAFAERVGITRRYLDMLLAEDRVMTGRLADLIRLKFAP
ncbi:MAG: hypothetical protein U0835_00550 [Isosphaeraceae bacterium]